MTDDIQPSILKAERSFSGDGTTQYTIWIYGIKSSIVERRAKLYAARQSRTTNVQTSQPEKTSVPARGKLMNGTVPDVVRVYKVEVIAHRRD